MYGNFLSSFRKKKKMTMILSEMLPSFMFIKSKKKKKKSIIIILVFLNSFHTLSFSEKFSRMHWRGVIKQKQQTTQP